MACRYFIHEFREYLKNNSKSTSTVDSYTNDIKSFTSYLDRYHIPLEEVQPSYIDEFLRTISLRENSIRRIIISIRLYFRYIAANHLSSESPLDQYPIPPRDESLPTTLSESDIDEVMSYLSERATKSFKHGRDLAIFTLLALEGCKASELIALEQQNFHCSHKDSYLTIKGPRTRTIKLAKQTKSAIESYMLALSSLQQQHELQSQQLFLALKGRDLGCILPSLTRHGLKFLLYELGLIIGHKGLNTELLRHYAIEYQLGSNKSLEQVMSHLGLRRPGNIAKHASLSRAFMGEIKT